MQAATRHASIRLLPACVAAFCISSEAAGLGTGRLVIDADGTEVRISLSGPALAMVGFDRPASNAAQRDTLSLAEENLRIGDAMIRFPHQADCRLLDARVDSDPAPSADEDMGILGAHYRFACANPPELDSAVVGVFTGFPFLARIHASYRVGEVRGKAVLTPTHPIVNLVPLE